MSYNFSGGFIKHCFVCGLIVDESRFDATKRDGFDLCSEACLEEYMDMSDYEFNKCKKEYLDADKAIPRS